MTTTPLHRVVVNALIGVDGTFTSPVNISAAIPNSLGPPIDWWARGSATNISGAIRKAGGGALITVATFGPFTEAASPKDQVITWTDSPSGSGSSMNTANISGPALGNGGWRITVAAPLFPDWYVLKMWGWDLPNRYITYHAFLDDTAGSTSVEYLDRNYNSDNGAYTSEKSITTEVKFAATEPGRTLVYEMTGGYQFEQGIYAVALYKAKLNTFPPRGGARAALLAGAAGPLGAQ